MIELSIIIPHFNSPERLEKLLKTIPVSDEIQIIVIDDQSSKYLDDYKKLPERFTHVNFTKNTSGVKGAGSCRNLGITLAEGNWLLFADSDDYFLDDFYSIIKKHFKSDKDIIFFSPTSYDEISCNPSDRHHYYEEIIREYLHGSEMKGELMLRYSFHVPWSKLFRTEFIKKNEIFFDEVIAANDVMFSVKSGHLMQKFDVKQIAIYCVTKNRGSLTMDMTEKVFDSRLHVHINYYQFLKHHLSSNELSEIGVHASFEYIRLAIFNRYGLKKVIQTLSLLRNSGLNVISIKYLSPKFLMAKIALYFDYYRKNHSYLKKRDDD